MRRGKEHVFHSNSKPEWCASRQSISPTLPYVHNDHGIESSRADCIVPIDYLSRDKRQHVLRTQSTHRHPSVDSGGAPQGTLERGGGALIIHTLHA